MRFQLPIQKSLYDYDERYKKVYEAGASMWSQPSVCQELLDFVKRLPKEACCLECGCGEGYVARRLADLEFHVTGVDLSSTVIEKNRQISSAKGIRFLVGDVTDLRSMHIPDQSFDCAIDIGCLHMMVEAADRIHYLKELKRVLKSGGLFYLQNGLNLESMTSENENKARELQRMKGFLSERPSKVTRKIETEQGETEIVLRVLPNKLLSLVEYAEELTNAGFTILSAKQGGGANMKFEAIVIAQS